MRLLALAAKTTAILRRDLLTAIRYRSSFLINVGGAAVELAAFYYLAHAVGPTVHPDGVEYFPFLVVGTGFYTFLVMGIHSFVQAVQEAQSSGTLEILLTTSTPAPTLVFLSAMSSFAASAAQFLLYVGAGLLLYRDAVPAPNLVGCFIIFLLSLAIAVALGIIAAALQLSIQRGSAVLWLLGSGTWFMTGTLFPVTTLPKPLQAISALIPITHSLDAMRLALLQGVSLTALGREISILLLCAGTLLPASLLTFAYSLKSAKRHGTLSFY